MAKKYRYPEDKGFVAAVKRGWRRLVRAVKAAVIGAFIALGLGVATGITYLVKTQTDPEGAAKIKRTTEVSIYRTRQIIAFFRDRAPPPAPNQVEASSETTCAFNANGAEMAKEMPHLYQDFRLASRLPLTGEHLYEVLYDPGRAIQSCVEPDTVDSGANGTFKDNKATMKESASTGTSLHEYFHALQEIGGAPVERYELSMRDAVAANLIMEATAAAYQMIAIKEAQNLGLSFRAPTKFRSAADNENTIKIFEDAYNQALASEGGFLSSTRERRALEAAGQAVVRHLLGGGDAGWGVGYADIAALNANLNSEQFPDDGREKKWGYKNKRESVFARMGAVSNNINLVPQEYLGRDAEGHIEQLMQKMGLSFTRGFVAPQQNPYRHPGV